MHNFHIIAAVQLWRQKLGFQLDSEQRICCKPGGAIESSKKHDSNLQYLFPCSENVFENQKSIQTIRGLFSNIQAAICNVSRNLVHPANQN